MSGDNIAGLVISFLVVIYLVAALIVPEKF
jgi:K+-transporting ATPase KdpF subunit